MIDFATLATLSDLFEGFTSQQRFILCLVVLGCTTVVTIVVGCTWVALWSEARKRETEAELTRDLLDQGKSAEEIERIIRPADGFSRAVGGWFGGKSR